MNASKLWDRKKNLFPQSRDPPTAMLDPKGNLVTSADMIKKLAGYILVPCWPFGIFQVLWCYSLCGVAGGDRVPLG